MLEVRTINYRYIFRYEDKTEVQIDIKLDPQTLNLITLPRKESPPPWTVLSFSQCEICPYTSQNMRYCPIAVNTSEVIRCFSDKESFKNAEVRVITNEREFYKKTSVQTALSSMMGIFMVTSGCKVMNILKPMVRHHLPFASIDEAIYRASSMYLLGQYFLKKKGKEPDWDLKKLSLAYENISKLNKAMATRLREASSKDANLNAIVILDVFAKTVPISIEQTLSKIEYLFNSYLEV